MAGNTVHEGNGPVPSSFHDSIFASGSGLVVETIGYPVTTVMNQTFAAPWSTALKVVSTTASAVLLAVALFIPAPPGSPATLWLMVRSLPLLILAACALCTVRGYEIAGGCLVVQRLGWKTRIPLQSLTTVEWRPGPFGFAWRTCGNGGLFSFSGWYYQKPLGSFRALATRTSDGVILTFSGRKPIVVTPDDSARFVEAVKAAKV